MEPIRQVPRLKVPLTLLLPDGWRGDVVDLSLTGIRIQCLAVLPMNTELTGTLVWPGGKKTEISGTVVWTAPPSFTELVPGEVGLQLFDVSQEYLDALAALFAELGDR